MPGQNLLDKAISYLAPSLGAKRARARVAISMVERAYDGAKSGRRTDGWIASGTSANAEIGPSLSKLRARSRDLCRNNPTAVKIIDALVINAVGTGIAAKLSDAETDYKAWAESTECDADGQHDIYGLQALVARTVFESGECLVRLRWRMPEDGLTVPLQLQVLEPDYLDSLKNEQLKNGGWILYGVEFDALGKRVAYWLFPQHPGEASPVLKAFESKRVPAEDVLHIYEKKRPGQVRGVPRLAPVMMTLRDIDDYKEAELLRKGIEACFAVFIRTDDESHYAGDLNAQKSAAAGSNIEDIRAGMIHRISGAESIEFGAPHAVQGFNEFLRLYQHDVSAGAGVTYELATGDLSQVNYSSIRAGTLEFRGGMEQFQWLTLIPMFCAPVVAAFGRAALLARKVKSPAITATHTPPRWNWVDPVKDLTGELLEIAAGLKSWQEGVRNRGRDAEHVLDEIAEDQARFKDKGVAIQIDKLALGAAGAAVNQDKGANQ